MKVKELMTSRVITIRPEEPVAVAARTLARYNIGALPVCNREGQLCGLITDRDIVTRCLAAERPAEVTTVGQIMTAGIHTVRPDMEASAAACLMGSRQVRRLPVTENGVLRGMLSLADLAQNQDSVYDATDALGQIAGNLSSR